MGYQASLDFKTKLKPLHLNLYFNKNLEDSESKNP